MRRCLLSSSSLWRCRGLGGCRWREDYEVGAGDTLRVVVLDQAALSGEFVVDAEGMITYPFLGRVKAAGMTTTEVERKLGTLLDGRLSEEAAAVGDSEGLREPADQPAGGGGQARARRA